MATSLILKRFHSSHSKAMKVFTDEVRLIYKRAGVLSEKVLVIGDDTFTFSNQLAMVRKIGLGMLATRPVAITDKTMKGMMMGSVNPFNMGSNEKLLEFAPEGFGFLIFYNPWSISAVNAFLGDVVSKLCITAGADIDLFMGAKEAEFNSEALACLGSAHGLVIDEFRILKGQGRNVLLRYHYP